MQSPNQDTDRPHRAWQRPSPSPYRLHALPDDFRYLHEPLRGDEAERWIGGRGELSKHLADRIMFSRGGAFLVTGYRGVGKTTFVHRALGKIRRYRESYAEHVGDFELLDVWLNVARPIDPIALMHLLVRQLVLRLNESEDLSRLEPELRRDLDTAFLRTSFEISGRSSKSEERSRTTSFETKWLGLEFLGKIAAGYKEATSAEEALKYLPYDERAAEFDVVRLSRALSSPGPLRPLGLWKRLGSWLQRRTVRSTRRPPFKVVFVIDELDKLGVQTEEKSESPLDEILESLKSIFTSTDFSFVFIAGRELRERWTRDVARGDSIYESVFSYDIYLPCLWDQQRALLERWLGEPATDIPRQAPVDLAGMVRYIQFIGRGIPRRLLRELNRHVVWDAGSPWLQLDHQEGRYVRVLAKLQEVLESLPTQLGFHAQVLDPLRFDAVRLAIYYSTDWILSRGGRAFSPEELQQVAMELNLGIAGSKYLGENFAWRLVESLSARDFLEMVSPAEETVFSRQALRRVRQFRLAPWVRDALRTSPIEQEEVSKPTRALSVGRDEMIGQYRVLSKLGAGGFGEVFLVTSPGEELRALKLMREDLNDDSSIRRFRREIEMLRRLEHPKVVRFYEDGNFNDRPFFTMDYVEGLTLGQILKRLKRLEPVVAIGVGVQLAEVLAFLHGKGIGRVDIKPANVMISDRGELKLIDLGIVKPVETRDARVDEITASGIIIGTPSYMAPEALKGEDAGLSADIYALGAVLYELITGCLPFQADSLPKTFLRILNGRLVPPSHLAEVDNALEQVVVRALQRDPEDRFSSMEEMARALAALAGEDSVDLAEIVDRASEEREGEVALETAIVDDGRTRRIFAESPGAVEVSTGVLSPSSASPAEPSAKSAVTLTPKESGDAVPPDVPTPQERERQRGGENLYLDEATELIHGDRHTVRRAALVDLARTDGTAFDGEILFDFEAGVCLLAMPEILAAPLARTKLTLGRDERADLRVDDVSVSRFHLTFTVSDGVEVEDLGSSNGILVNGKRVEHATLVDGDTLQFGGLLLRVHLFTASENSRFLAEASESPEIDLGDARLKE